MEGVVVMMAAAGASEAGTPTPRGGGRRGICVDTLPSAGDKWENRPAASRRRRRTVCGQIGRKKTYSNGDAQRHLAEKLCR